MNICEGPQNYYYLSLMKEKDRRTIHGLGHNTIQRITHSFVVLFRLTRTLLQTYYRSSTNIESAIRVRIQYCWEHGRNKHGTCMFNKCDEHDYFKKALTDLYQMVKEKDLIFKYQTTQTRAMVPFTSKFAIGTAPGSIENKNHLFLV